MAILEPSWDVIEKFRQKPSIGELTLLKFLVDNLDDSYEVYFQPFINGDKPDIIIMRKESGVYIFEVKDWYLNNYCLDEKNNWYVIKNGNKYLILSPLQQLLKYKNNLYNLHIEGLLEKKILNYKALAIVNCGVYFHNENYNNIINFLSKNKDNKNTKNYYKYEKFLSYFDILGKDSLNPKILQNIIENRYLNRQSKLFDEKLYSSFKRYLKPPMHYYDQGKIIEYNDEQKKVLESRPKIQQKFKGISGSGKTTCLARRAVNAHKRHKGKVLILTFNLTLRNYIHDKLNEVREDFNWGYFHIINYHEFFLQQAANYNLYIDYNNFEKYFDNENFFESVSDNTERYKTIIIDEIQDFKKEWIKIISKYFLDKEEGEFVVCGDEKQNIYDRDIEDKKPYTGIPGAWNILKNSYRNTGNILKLAYLFQKHFLNEKYDLDIFDVKSEQLINEEIISYKKLNSLDIASIVDLYRKISMEKMIHDNDIAFLSVDVEPLRDICYYLRTRHKIKTNTTFETKEFYDNSVLKANNLVNKIKNNNKEVDKLTLEKIKNSYIAKSNTKIRKNKKINFWLNSGTIKLSTIFSFKGYEIDTVFLILTDSNLKKAKIENSESFLEDELIYTAITRAKNNLIIINIDNYKYDKFFRSICESELKIGII